MLGKLMKHEFRATGRVFLPIYGALLAVALVNRLFYGLDIELPRTLFTIVAVMLIVSVAVVTLILTIQRFRENLLGTQGYLMFTLPVRIDTLIVSKLFTAVIWFLASGLVVLFSILIMVLNSSALNDFFTMLSRIPLEGNAIVWLAAEFFAMLIVSLLSTVLLFYASMSVSVLFNTHRGLAAFGAFITLSVVSQIAMGILPSIAALSDPLAALKMIDPYHMAAVAMGCILLWEAVFGTGYYLLSRYILKKKLNLE